MKNKDLQLFIPIILEILIFVCFYTIVKEDGSGLFSYAYLIYFLVKALGISSLVTSYKTIKEYPDLNQEKDKRIFDIQKCFFGGFGLILFVLIMIFAPNLTYSIVKDNSNIQEISFIIRMMSFSLLTIPILNTFRGYLLSRDNKKEIYYSVIIEKIVMFLSFIITSILCNKIFNLTLFKTIGISSLTMIIGSILSLLYLILKLKKNKKTSKNLRSPVPVKEVIKKILSHFKIVFAICLFFVIYQFVDMFTLTSLYITKFNYSLDLVQKVMSVVSTFGFQLNIFLTIIILIIFLNVTNIKNSKLDVVEIIQKEFPKFIYIALPLTIVFAILSCPIWVLFYGKSIVMESIYGIYSFSFIATCLFLFVFSLLLFNKEYKVLFSLLGLSLLLKISLDGAFSNAFVTMSLKAYYGLIFSSILGYLSFVFLGFTFYYFKYKLDYENLLHRVFDIVISSLIMAIPLLVLMLLIQGFITNRIIAFLVILVCFIISSVIYLYITKKNGLAKNLFKDNKRTESI